MGGGEACLAKECGHCSAAGWQARQVLKQFISVSDNSEGR